MKTKLHIVYLTLVFLLLLVCIGFVLSYAWGRVLTIQQITPKTIEPYQDTHSLAPLSRENIPLMREITRLDVPNKTSSVVAISQRANDGKLLAIYDDGTFREWNIASQKTSSEFDFLCASRDGVNFDADGILVVTPGTVLADGLNGYNIWNTQTGERIYCWGPQCPDGDPEDIEFIDTGIVLEPNGKWIVNYHGSAIGADGLRENISPVISIDDRMDNIKPQIVKMIFDPSGKYIAYALKDGIIKIFESDYYLGPIEPIESEEILLRSRTFRYSSIWSSDSLVALMFDNTRRWLASLTKTELKIWDLEGLIHFHPIQMPIENGNSITYNSTGDELVVGTEKEIIIMDMKNNGQVIAKFNVEEEVTALNFTRDDRLLVWGDKNGALHLWGIK